MFIYLNFARSRSFNQVETCDVLQDRFRTDTVLKQTPFKSSNRTVRSMGRYQVSVGKVPIRNSPKPKLYVEVQRLVVKGKSEAGQGSSAQSDPADESPVPPQAQDYVKLMAFEVTEPTARYIKVVTLANADATKGGVWEAHSASAQDPDEKSVQILHKRKSAGRVVSFSEATSTILNRTGQRPSDVDTEEQEAAPYEKAAVKGQLRTLTIDVNELKNSEKITFCLDPENELFGPGTDSTFMDIIKLDENGNDGSKELIGGTETNTGEASETDPAQTEAVPPVYDPPEIESEVMIMDPSVPREEGPESPVKIHITVANDLMLTIELESNFEEKTDTTNNNAGSTSDRDSAVSIIDSDIDFHLPYQHVFLDQCTGPQIPFPTFSVEKEEVRQDRKLLLKRLILQRLIALGAPSLQAHNITDRWHTGYVQHRALSYRVPVVRTQADSRAAADKAGRPRPIQLGTGSLELSAGFLPVFLRHVDVLRGTLNSATCTILETTFFLMIPHFKTRVDTSSSPHLPGAGICPTFIDNWVEALKVTAHQLKPREPLSVRDLVKKEVKLIRKLLGATEKACKKMKERMKDMTEKSQLLADKTARRLKPNPEWKEAIERKEEPAHYAGFSHLQMVGFSAPNIFQDYLYLMTTKFGLFLKRRIEENWFPYSDLNFLERRVIFLGLTDHMYSSFEAALTTIRRMEELFTPGYPMSCISRINTLFEFLGSEKPFSLLSPEGKNKVYSGVCSCVGAMTRFKYVYQELAKMIKDASHGMTKGEFTLEPLALANYDDQLKQQKDGQKINLIVPFTTLNLEGFSDLPNRNLGPSPNDEDL